LLTNPEWKKWSNREIAKQCRVSEHLVRRVQDSLETPGDDSSLRQCRSEDRTYTTKHGTTTTMNTANIGHKAEAQPVAEGEPPATGDATAGQAEATEEATTAAEMAPVPAPGTRVMDQLGKEVPFNLDPVFSENLKSVKAQINAINAIKREAQALCESALKPFLAGFLQSLLADLENAKQVFRIAEPFTVCPHCKGSGCRAPKAVCKGTGFITEDLHKRLAKREVA
jgi:hypothetical protein